MIPRPGPWAAFFFLLAFAPAAATAAVPARERAALLDLYHQTGGDAWADRSGWLGPKGSECSWHGVHCAADGSAGSAITGLDLTGNGLTGELPATLAGLPHLRTLVLRSNRLQGEIPAALGGLSELEVLDLSFNRLAGAVPPDLGALARLRSLQLGHDDLTALPDALGNLGALEALGLDETQISDLPPGLRRLTRLRTLSARGARLRDLPEALAGLRSLLFLDLSGNPMHGAELPSWLGDLAVLQGLALADDGLAGPVPPAIGGLGALSTLDLRGNALTALPAEIGSLHALSELRLDRNRLPALPAEVAGLEDLTVLTASENELAEVPADLTRLSRLRVLDLSRNRLTSVPPIGETGKATLESLDLSSNLLAGDLGEILDRADLSRLRRLDLSGNPFVPGPVPERIRQLSGLRELELHDTGRTGAIPDWLGELAGLERLDLSRNPFDAGPVPLSYLFLSRLRRLLLEDTARTGPFPDWLGNLSLLAVLSLRDNPFDPGPVPAFFARTHVGTLDLSGTERTGLLPPDLGDSRTLRILRLDRNHLSGPLPEEWGSLTTLEVLTVSANRLTGAVPEEIALLPALRDRGGIDLRWNGLTQGDPEIVARLDRKQVDGVDWRDTQTAPPRRPTAALDGGPADVLLTWDPIRFQQGGGYFEIFHADSPLGPFVSVGRTADKRQTSFRVAGLAPRARHWFRIRTVSEPGADNPNRVVSRPTPVVAITTLP
jgi:Leucine-rich repeat (LRR) protein